MSDAPGFWMNETSGALRPAVVAYLAGRRRHMTPEQVAAMRAYLRQWIAGDFRGPGVASLRATVGRIRTRADISAWLDAAGEIGIDPL